MLAVTSSVRDQVLATVDQLLGDHEQFESWFKGLDFRQASDETVQIAVANPFIKELFERKYLGYLQEAFRRALGGQVRINVVVAAARGPVAAPASAPASASGASGTALPLAEPVLPEYRPAPAPPAAAFEAGRAAPATSAHPQLNPNYTFDNFVVCPENRLAHAAALAVADNPARAYNPLFVHASVGLGKTHLLQAVCHTLLQRNPRIALQYLSCEEFVNEYISAVQRKSLETFRKGFRSADVLVIDDIHFLADKLSSQEEIFHTFNTLHNAQKQIILSSDQAPQDIPTLEERLVSRFKWGLVAPLGAPGLEARIAILRQRAEMMQHDMPPGGIPDDVLTFIATHVYRNIRELIGAINNVIGSARSGGNAITLASAREALQHIVELSITNVDIHRIQEEVAKYFGVKPTDLTSRKRGKNNIAQARHVAVYLARHMTRLSQAEVGEHFGDRDHTTILNSEQTVAEKIASDTDFKGMIEKLQTRILKQPSPA